MGLFDGLFEKKVCCICEGEIGLLGNRKLEDGNLCKDCAEKLSPWFSDRRNSTVEEIREQLEYREANKEKVAAFNTTRTFGEYTKLLIDEDAGVFMVTSARDLEEANPDVLSLADVTGCIFDINESQTEMKRRDAEGKYVSYNPARYTHNYNFYVTIQVNNPYFDEIEFRLNSSSVDIDEPEPERAPVRSHAATRPAPTARSAAKMAKSTAAAVVEEVVAAVTAAEPKVDPESNVDYCEYRKMGEEVKEMLLQARQEARKEAAEASAPKAVVNCPRCGAPTTPDAAGCCEFCGSAVAE